MPSLLHFKSSGKAITLISDIRPSFSLAFRFSFSFYSGHCLAGFPLGPDLRNPDDLFMDTPPRPMPGQASALSKPPPREPARARSSYCRGRSGEQAMWRPFGSLLDPPGIPDMSADLYEELLSEGCETPTGWGCAKAAHISAFAAAPGASKRHRLRGSTHGGVAKAFAGLIGSWADREDSDEDEDYECYGADECYMEFLVGYPSPSMFGR